jgi:hypothetical protein
LGGPRLDHWLALRPGDLIAQRLLVLVEEPSAEGAHWIVVAGFDQQRQAWDYCVVSLRRRPGFAA